MDYQIDFEIELILNIGNLILGFTVRVVYRSLIC